MLKPQRVKPACSGFRSICSYAHAKNPLPCAAGSGLFRAEQQARESRLQDTSDNPFRQHPEVHQPPSKPLPDQQQIHPPLLKESDGKGRPRTGTIREDRALSNLAPVNAANGNACQHSCLSGQGQFSVKTADKDQRQVQPNTSTSAGIINELQQTCHSGQYGQAPAQADKRAQQQMQMVPAIACIADASRLSWTGPAGLERGTDLVQQMQTNSAIPCAANANKLHQTRPFGQHAQATAQAANRAQQEEQTIPATICTVSASNFQQTDPAGRPGPLDAQRADYPLQQAQNDPVIACKTNASEPQQNGLFAQPNAQAPNSAQEQALSNPGIAGTANASGLPSAGPDFRPVSLSTWPSQRPQISRSLADMMNPNNPAFDPAVRESHRAVLAYQKSTATRGRGGRKSRAKKYSTLSRADHAFYLENFGERLS